jgi:IS5 family transposase
MRPRPAISPIAAIATAVLSMRVERAKNRTKSKVRVRVEHPIGVLKRVFGFVKVRYRGLAKDTHRLLVNCALANLFMARRHLLRRQPV